MRFILVGYVKVYFLCVCDPYLGGTNLTIGGNGFGAVQLDGKVLVGDKPCSVVSWAQSSITCTLPSSPPGLNKVKVFPRKDVLADNKYARFQLLTSPLCYSQLCISTLHSIAGVRYVLEVDDVTPTRGSVFGATQLTVTGRGFEDHPTMKVSAAMCKAIVVGHNLISVLCQGLGRERTVCIGRTDVFSNKMQGC